MTIPLLDLKTAEDPECRELLLEQLRDALFSIGFLYISNHGVPEATISELTGLMPALFNLSDASKAGLSKLNSPHFLGYSGLAEETTQGKCDFREQFDFATELPVVFQEDRNGGCRGRDFSKVYWKLRGPNQWPREDEMPGFRNALLNYHDALSELSYRFVHLVEEAFAIPIGTFDHFFSSPSSPFASAPTPSSKLPPSPKSNFLPPQHRLKLLKYHVTSADSQDQGVGPHKDSSGWLTFLHQVGGEQAPPVAGTFVVNFGNAFEAATEGAVRATVHRVRAPTERDRYSIPFFMGLPLDLRVSEIRSFVPEDVRLMRRRDEGQDAVEAALPTFLDPRWDCLGESQLRKWIRSHQDVGRKWYGSEMLEYYSQ
ncbi:hypothetical protein BDR22DRAFT_881753 [Usnea florida]